MNARPDTYQLLPPLSTEEYAALKADIAEHGIRVPVDVDEDGVILDGHHRAQVARELGIGYPTRTLAGLTAEEKRGHALAVNSHRRQLTREQRRQLAAAELERDPSRSDRAIARDVGVDHKTVGAIRRGGWGIPHPEATDGQRPLAEQTLEELEEPARSDLQKADETIVEAVFKRLVSPAVIAKELQSARDQFREEHADTFGEDFAVTDEVLFGTRLDFLAGAYRLWEGWKVKADEESGARLDAWGTARPEQLQRELTLWHEAGATTAAPNPSLARREAEMVEGYPVHPALAVIPPMRPHERASLADDIKRHGLVMPITLYQGQILDGRERLRACVATGTDAVFRTYEGDNPMAYVWSVNMLRMNLTDDQRAAFAAKAEVMKEAAETR